MGRSASSVAQAPAVSRPLLTTALAAAEAAAEMQRHWVGRVDAAQASEKGARDFVSRADLEAQQAALEVIRRHHPDHAVLAEEGEAARTRSTAGALWVIDPIDGTTNFLHGHPMYAISVAVLEDGSPAAAVVIAPATGERWWAIQGGGAFKNGRRVRVSAATGIRTALIGTGFPFKAIHLLPDYLGQLGRVIQGSAGARRAGSAALDLAYLASGQLDAFWELDLFPWDYMAGVLLIREAGGVVSRVDGSPVGLEPGSVLAAANPGLAEQLRQLVERS